MTSKRHSSRNAESGMSKALQQMVSIIVRGFNPEKIILFGSQARGDARPDSDFDLLVIMPDGGSKRGRQMAIRLALAGIHVPKDILVSTPEEFAWRQHIPGTFERPAMLEGKTLYART